MQDLAKRYLQYIQNNGASKNTVKNYSSDLSKYFDWVNASKISPKNIKRKQLVDFEAHLAPSTFSVSSKRRILSTAKSFTEWKLNNDLFEALAQPYLLYIESQGASKNTLKNYTADLNKFISYIVSQDLHPKKPTHITPDDLESFKKHLNTLELSEASKRRTTSSVTKFYTWGKSHSLIYSGVSPKIKRNYSKFLLPLVSLKQLAYIVPLFVLLGSFYSFYPQIHAYANENVIEKVKEIVASSQGKVLGTTSPDYLSYQGRLLDDNGSPITASTNFLFKIYDQSTGGTQLWSSGTCSIDPDNDGVFNTTLGDSCGSGFSPTLFADNPNPYLEVTIVSETLSPRQPISAVPYAINADAIDGIDGDSLLRSDLSDTFAGSYDQTLTLQSSLTGNRSTDLLSITQSNNATYSMSADLVSISQADTSSTGNAFYLQNLGSGLAFRVDDSATDTTPFVIDSTGNVGIGTSTPQAYLDVAGSTTSQASARIRSGSTPTSPTAGDIYSDGTELYFYDGSGWVDLTYGDGGSGAVAWDNITDPTANLSLAMSTYLTTFNWDTGTGTNDLFNLTSDNSATGTGSLLNIQTGTSSTVKPLRVRAGSVEALYVDQSGNVGLGTTTVDAELSVYDKNADGHTEVVLGVANMARGARFIKDSSASPYNFDFYWSDHPTTEAGELNFYSSQDSGELVTFEPSGEVGIGTVDPLFDLHISGINDSALYLEADRAGSASEDNNAFVKFSQDGGAVQAIIGTVGNAGFDPENVAYSNTLANATLFGTLDTNGALQFGTNDAVRMTIATGGNVGIGTAVPGAYKLNVYGDLALTNTGDLYSYGTQTLGTRQYTENNYITDAETFTSSIDKLDMQVADIVAGAGGVWSRDPGILYPGTLTDNVSIGTSSNIAKLGIDGDTDEIQLLVQGNSAQTSNIVVFENNLGTDLFTLTNAGAGTFTGAISASNFSGSSSGTNTGDITLSAIGSTPNANAATLTGQVLNLQPASASFGGVVTTGTQTFAGAKTLTGLLTTQAGIANSGAAITNSSAYTQSGTSANTFTGTSTFSNATYSALFTGGNVGMGTTSPSSDLHVYNSASSSTIRVNSQVNNANGALLRLTEGDAATYGFLGGYVRYEGNANRLDIGVHDTADTSYANDSNSISILRSGGNVGIGTTTPGAYKLNVYGDLALTNSGDLYSYGTQTLGNRAYTEQNYVTNAQTFTASIDALDQQVYSLVVGAGGLWQDAGTYIYADNTAGNNVVVTDTGNVGIGTTVADFRLDVEGNSRFQDKLEIDSDSNQTNWGHVYIGNQTGWGGIAYPTIGSTGGSSGSLIMLDNPHITYRTDNTFSGRTGKAGLRLATQAAGSPYYDAAVTNLGYEILYSGNTSLIPLRIETDGDVFLAGSGTGNVGIGMTSASQQLDVNGNIRSRSGIRTPASFEWSGRSAYFTNGLSDQVAYINLGNNQIWGWVEVTLTDAYSNQNTVGKYTKRYYIGRNPGGACGASSEVPAAFGPVATQWKLGDCEVDGSNNVRIPIYHLVTTGNSISVKVEGQIYDTGAQINAILGDIAVSAPSTVANSETRDYVHFEDSRVGIGSTAPGSQLDVVTSGANIISKFASDGGRPRLEIGRADSTFDTWGIPIRATGGSSASSLRLQSDTGGIQLYDASTAYWLNIYNGSSSKILLASNGDSYLNGGNVGIGTTNPGSYRLNVAGATYLGGNTIVGQSGTNSRFQIYNDEDITAAPNTKGLRITESAGDWLLSLGISGVTNTGFAIRDITAGTYPFVIRETTGRVGINTSGPSSQLEVNGDIELTNLLDNDATNFFDGGCSATETVSGISSTGAITCIPVTGVPASSMSFTNLTSGTNTQAAMVVGTGASLNYTGSGTINASTLGTKAESVFFTLSENETVSGIPAFNGGTTGSTAPFTVDSTYLVANLNADLLDGWDLATASTVSTVVGRDGSGDINARLFRSEYDTTNANIGYIMTQIDTASNNYIRPSTPAQLVTGLGLEAGGSRDIWVEKAGDTMTGNLNNTATQIQIDSASYARYVADSNNSWSYLRLADNGAVTWDIASYDGGNFELRPGGASSQRLIYTSSGQLQLEGSSQDTINLTYNSTDDNRGIAFNDRTALSADYNDGWLRLNNNSEFASGVYTPGSIRADGGINLNNSAITNINWAASDDGSGSGLDADLLDGINSTDILNNTAVSESESNLAVGWYTIAANSGNRATARFGIRDVTGSRHQSLTFYASHHYGAQSEITTQHSSRFSGTPFRYVRIKEGSTYDGAMLQVYIDDPTNSVTAYLLGDNFQTSGWVLKDWIPDGTNPGTVSNFAALTNVAAQIDIDQTIDGGLVTTGAIYSGGDTTQYEVCNTSGNCGTAGMPSGTSGQTLRHNGSDWVANSLLFNNGTNVGIGTASPNDKLDIWAANSQLRFTDSDDGQYSQFSLSADMLALRHNTTSGTPAVTFADSGNVGINTTNASAKLTVQDNLSTHSILARFENENTTLNESSIRFRARSAANAPAHADVGVYSTGSDTGNFFIKFPYSNSEQTNVRLAIDHTGNVGIGSTAPGNLLDINTTSTTSGIAFDNREALTGFSGDTWLRLNQNSQWTSGTYTPQGLRADGGLAASGYALAAGEVRANLFRDGTGAYLLDPASTGTSLNVAGSGVFGGDLTVSGLLPTGGHNLIRNADLSYGDYTYWSNPWGYAGYSYSRAISSDITAPVRSHNKSTFTITAVGGSGDAAAGAFYITDLTLNTDYNISCYVKTSSAVQGYFNVLRHYQDWTGRSDANVSWSYSNDGNWYRVGGSFNTGVRPNVQIHLRGFTTTGSWDITGCQLTKGTQMNTFDLHPSDAVYAQDSSLGTTYALYPKIINSYGTLASAYGIYIPAPSGTITNKYALVTEAGAGNVGIGTTNPGSYRLNVAGTTYLGGNTVVGQSGTNSRFQIYNDEDITAAPNTKGLRITESTGDWLLSLGISGVTNTGFAIRDITAGTYPFVIRETTGRVGINTSGPSSQLEVSGDIELTNLRDNDATNFFDGGCSATETITGISANGAISCTAIAISGSGITADSLDYVDFEDVMDLDATTEVNLANFNYNFDLNGTGDFQIMDAGVVQHIFYDTGDVRLGNNNELYVDTSAARVGIGTASPAYNLEIESTGDAALYLEADTASGTEDNNAFVKFMQDGGGVSAYAGQVGNAGFDPENVAYTGTLANAFLISNNWNSSASAVQFGIYNDVKMTILGTNGNVGIGSTAPGNLLDINTTSTTSGIAFDNQEALTGFSGDAWLRLNQNNQWTSGVYTPGNLRVDGVIYVDNGVNYLSDVSGNYGSVQVNAGGTGGYEGFSIDGRAVFMHNGSTTTGIYNDVNNEWLFRSVHNAEAQLYYNGTARLGTTTAGAEVIGDYFKVGDRRQVLSDYNTSTYANGYLLTTSIPYDGVTTRGMHSIRVKGYAYGSADPIDFVVNFYLYSSGLSNHGWTNYGAYDPGTVKLSYEGNIVKLWWSNVQYYASFDVETFSHGAYGLTQSWFEGWDITDAAAPSTNTVDVTYRAAEPQGLAMGGNIWDVDGNLVLADTVDIGSATTGLRVATNGTISDIDGGTVAISDSLSTTGDITITGNDLNFGNGSSISNATNGDLAITGDGEILMRGSGSGSYFNIQSATGGASNTHFLYGGDDDIYLSYGSNVGSDFIVRSGGTTRLNIDYNGNTQLYGGEFRIDEASPQIYLRDTDTEDDFWMHVNSNNFYVLADRDDNGSWEGPNPLQLEADTNTAYTFGNEICTSAGNCGATGVSADSLDFIHFQDALNLDASTSIDIESYALSIQDDNPDATLALTGSTLNIIGPAATARTDTSVAKVLTLHRDNTAATASKGSTFSVGLSFWEDPGNNYPRTKVDFMTTGRTTDDADAGNTVLSLYDTGNGTLTGDLTVSGANLYIGDDGEIRDGGTNYVYTPDSFGTEGTLYVGGSIIYDNENLYLDLDNNNNGTNALYIRNGANGNIAYFHENNNMYLTGDAYIYGGDIRDNESMGIHLDDNNNGTGDYFRVYNGADGTIFSVAENTGDTYARGHTRIGYSGAESDTSDMLTVRSNSGTGSVTGLGSSAWSHTGFLAVNAYQVDPRPYSGSPATTGNMKYYGGHYSVATQAGMLMFVGNGGGWNFYNSTTAGLNDGDEIAWTTLFSVPEAGGFNAYGDSTVSGSLNADSWADTVKVTNLNADLLDDMTATSGATGSTIMSRNGSGDTSVRYLNSSYVNMSHGAATRNSDTVFYSSTDNYIRKNTVAGMRASLGIDAGGSGDIWVEKAGDTMTGTLVIDTASSTSAMQIINGNGSHTWFNYQNNNLNYIRGTTTYVDTTLDMNDNNIIDVQEIRFNDGANHAIGSNGSGLLFDGGDGTWDFLVYDNSIYSDTLRLGYSGSAQIITHDTNENLTIDPNGTGSIIINGDTSINGVTRSYSAVGAADNVRTGLAHYDTTAMAAGVGGQLVLGYKYTTAGNYTEGAIIKMYKENATNGQYGSGLKFQVRNHGENLATQMTIDPTGNLQLNQDLTVSGGNLYIGNDGEIRDNGTNSLYTPDLFRADGGLYVSDDEGWVRKSEDVLSTVADHIDMDNYDIYDVDSVDANIFRDDSDTAYYLDPASTGTSLNIAGNIVANNGHFKNGFIGFKDYGGDYSVVGDLGNTLYRADQRFTCTNCSSSVFDSHLDSYATYAQSATDVTYTINFNGARHYWYALQISFMWSSYSQNFTIQRLRDTDTTANGSCDGGGDESWENVAIVTGNTSNQYTTRDNLGSWICGFRVTFGVDDSDLNPTHDIMRLAEIMGWQYNYNSETGRYASRNGFSMYGNIDMLNGNIYDSNSNLVLNDTVDIGSATTGLRVATNGSILDIDTGTVSVSDALSATGSVTAAGVVRIGNTAWTNNVSTLRDSAGDLYIDPGSGDLRLNYNVVATTYFGAGTGVAGASIDSTGLFYTQGGIDVAIGSIYSSGGNLTLNDTVDIGSATTGLRVATNGTISDIDTGTVAISDNLSTTGDVTVTGGNLYIGNDGEIRDNGTNYLYTPDTFGIGGNAFVSGYITEDFDMQRDNIISFYGDTSSNHSISSRNGTWAEADDIRLNSYGAVYINLDSNNNNTSGADFQIGRHGASGTISDWLFTLSGETGNGTFTGDVTVTGGNLYIGNDGEIRDNGTNALYTPDSFTAGGSLYTNGNLYVGSSVIYDNDNLYLDLDNDNNGTNALYIRNGANGNIAYFHENNNMYLTGDLIVYGGDIIDNESINIHLDNNNNGTGDYFRVYNGGDGTMFSLQESTANAYLAGALDIRSYIYDAGGNLVLNDTVDIGGSTTGLRVGTNGSIYDIDGNIELSDTVRSTGNYYLNNGSPTIYLQDTDHYSSMIHQNSNIFYILRGSGVNSTSWSQYGGYWPLEINMTNNNAYFGGELQSKNFYPRDFVCCGAGGYPTVGNHIGSPSRYHVSINAYRVNSKDSAIHGFDLAENMPFEGDLEAGDVVVAHPTKKETVKGSTSSYQQTVMGIVSTSPGITLGTNWSKDSIEKYGDIPMKPIALAGRVPVKVTLESGVIKQNDKITSSSTPKFGMKATKAGHVVAVAMEKFEPDPVKCSAVTSVSDIVWPTDEDGHNSTKPCFYTPDGKFYGKIMALVNASWYDPQVYLANGDLILSSNRGSYEVKSIATNTKIDRVAALSEATIANLTSGKTTTQELQVIGQALVTDLTVQNLTIGTQSLQNYTLGITSELASKVEANTVYLQNLNQQIAIVENFGDVTDLTLIVDDMQTVMTDLQGKVNSGTVQKQIETSEVFEEGDLVSYTDSLTYEKSENAKAQMFAGVITSLTGFNPDEGSTLEKTMTNYGTAIVKVTTKTGTVMKGDLVAISNVAGFGDKYTDQSYVVGTALEDANYTEVVLPDPTDPTSAYSTGTVVVNINPQSMMTAAPVFNEGLSGLTASSDTLSINYTNTNIYGDFNVLGDSTATNLVATNKISTGLITIDGTDNSINAMASTLQLQNKPGAGNIEIFGTKILLSNDGSIVTSGSITVKSVAVDTTEQVSATLGSAQIQPGQTTVFIPTVAISNNSKVFVTPTQIDISSPLVVSQKNAGLGFTVEVATASPSIIEFDWFIVEEIASAQ